MRDRVWVGSLILAFSLLPVFTINQYRFGIGNQSITIPFVKAALDERLYPDDYLVAQRPYFFTHFWNVLALFLRRLPVRMEALFFIIYCASVYLSFLAMYLIARTLFKRTDVALLSLFFLLFDKAPLGARSLFPNYLDTVIISCPFLLFAIHAFLTRRYALSFFLQGLVFLIHPLNAIYLITVLSVSALVMRRTIGTNRMLACFSLLLLTLSPSLIWKLTGTPESLRFFYADPRWLELLRLRSPYHAFPLSWSIDDVFRGAALVYVFLTCWKYRPDPEHHRIIAWSTGAILTLWGIGTLFAEVIPVSIVIQSQLFRSSTLILVFAILYYSNFFCRELDSARSVSDKCMAAFLALGILYGARGWSYALIAFWGLALCLIVLKEARGSPIPIRQFVPALLSVACILGAGAYHMSGGFTISNANEANWLEAQRWARASTKRGDVFIVPPQLGTVGFRIESERTIYGDWKDGTQMFFNPDFGYEWFKRMKRLGYRDGDTPGDDTLRKQYEALDEGHFRGIAREFVRPGRRVFLVGFTGSQSLSFPRVHSNPRYVIYEVEP